MINNRLKIGLLLLLTGKFSNLFAHDIINSLGPDSSASDYYQVQCFNDGNGDANRLEVTLISKKKAAPIVSMQVVTENPLSVSSATDNIGGDKTTSRTLVVANDNNGTANGYYYFTVNKTRAGVQKYQIRYHCMSQTGHAGTDSVAIQQQ